jgi:hypothetical protein
MRLKRNIAVSESGFLFDPTTGESYSLNGQGTDILNLIKEKKSDAEITGIMTETYEVSPDEFEKYYLDFIGMLRQFKLLEDEQPE